ncbi:MAG: iron ABC transporter permease [Calditrichaceae bacterium]|nr:iron ABC transporter permease [Calditrichaceae bacterium]
MLGDPDSLSAQILFDIRIPRILFSLMTGACLALIGAVFQGLLRNDLATPYTLGVSSGGALGAVIAIKLGLVLQIAGFSLITLFSISGSLLSILIIYIIAGRRGGFSGYGLILGGVAVSLSFSAITMFIHYLADFTQTYRMVHWLMGSLAIRGWIYPVVLSVITLAVFIYFQYHVKAFNILLAGKEFAVSKGVAVDKLRSASFILGSLVIGYIVSIAGPIGFVGLVIPHIIRLLLGPDHKSLFPYCILMGGAFLVWCDTLARLIIYPAELPVGILTSLIGGPFFIFLLIKGKKL